MSRYCGNKDTRPILDAAAHWKEVALLGDGSVFTDKHLWTVEGLTALEQYFVHNLDESDQKFIPKLEKQLAPVAPSAKQLAAEMMWLLYLCPSSLTPRHKREVAQTIWSWSDEAFPQESPLLSESVLQGIGSAGPGFNQNQWRELAFLINFTLKFQQLPLEERKGLLDDGWAFASWLKNVPDWRARQLRHMLLFLLFPDDFERIFGQRDRLAIALAFSGLEKPAVNKLDPLELDRVLRDTRKKLESEYGTAELDYYLPPLNEKWKSEGFAASTEGITAADVRKAIADIDRDGVPKGAESTGYDLVEAGRRYPPKLVLSIAAKYANGEELDRREFTGGEESSAFRLLRKLGFHINAKDLVKTLVDKFLAQAQGGSELGVQGYLDIYRGLEVKVSFGKGNVARIPWIAFLGSGQLVSKGIYPVLLLFREENLLLLCYGVSEENAAEQSWGNLGDARTVQTWFNARFRRNPDRYGASHVLAAYDLTQALPAQDLNEKLDRMIDQYKDIVDVDQSRSTPPASELPVRQDIGEAVRSFSTALRQSFVSFGAEHDTLVASFIASVATKPLIILTGLSGSGKTQIALRFGQWLGHNSLYVAAVRPDWTGAEALFGYEDGLKPVVDGRAAWSVPAPLEFMLQACKDIEHPYLLLLDEMNLAHVERYFADVLSGMESGEPCLPNLGIGPDGMWRTKPSAPAKLPFPRNLWVVGTVNVDETTYMFSPKVLDRATTFEFRVSTDDLQVAGTKPTHCDAGEPALLRGLLSIARDDAWHRANPSSFGAALDGKLRQLHRVLARYGLEFGHRVFYESLRFAALSERAGLGALEPVLDRIVLQKILPRLHGSRRRLELPVLALAHFCRDLPEVVEADEKLAALRVEESGNKVKLPASYDKLCRLLRSLRANQFASFTE